MKNLPLIIGLLSTIILSLYCVDLHTEPILNKLNHQIVQKKCSKTVKTKNYVEVMAKPITPKKIELPQVKTRIIEKSKATPIVKKTAPKKENELDILAKKILEDMNKNKDEKWKQ